MRHIKTALLAAIAVGALSAPAFADDLKLGILLGLTGPLESMSPPMVNSAKLALQEVNDQGGINGAKIDADVADDSCITAATATAAADKLVNTDKVVGIVGAMCSGVTIAVANTVAIPAGITMISPSATAPTLSTIDDKDLFFRTAPSDAYNGQALAYLLTQKGIKDIGITYINTDYGKGLAQSLADAFKADGGTVSANVAHEDGKADYRAELGQISATGTKALAIIAYANGSGHTILQQAVESGDFTTYIGGDGMTDDSLFQGIDTKAVEGFIGVHPGSASGPGPDAFVALATAGGVDPKATYTPESYDAAFVFALALAKNGGKTEGLPAAVRAVTSGSGETILPGEWKKAWADLSAGKDVNYDGATGNLDFDKNGDVSGLVAELTVKDGHFITVGPIALPAAK